MSSENIDWGSIGQEIGQTWGDRAKSLGHPGWRKFMQGFVMAFMPRAEREPTEVERAEAWREALAQVTPEE